MCQPFSIVSAPSNTITQIPNTASTSPRKCRICPLKLTSSGCPSSSLSVGFSRFRLLIDSWCACSTSWAQWRNFAVRKVWMIASKKITEATRLNGSSAIRPIKIPTIPSACASAAAYASSGKGKLTGSPCPPPSAAESIEPAARLSRTNRVIPMRDLRDNISFEGKRPSPSAQERSRPF